MSLRKAILEAIVSRALLYLSWRCIPPLPPLPPRANNLSVYFDHLPLVSTAHSLWIV
jgi:hypothetical protein